MKIDKETLLKPLPSNILDSDAISEEAKRLLGGLIWWLENSQASETGRIIIDNAKLSNIVGISKGTLLTAITHLKEHKLIDRIAGHKRVQGKPNQASEYFIHWDNLDKPLVPITYEERIAQLRKITGTVYNSIKYNGIKYNGISLDNIEENSIEKNGIISDNIEENNIKENGTTLNNIFTEKIEEDNNKEMEHIDNVKEKSSILENKKEEEIKAKLDNIYTKLFTEEVPFKDNNNIPIEEKNVPLEKPLTEEKKETNLTRNHSIEEGIDAFVELFKDKYLSHASSWQDLQHKQEVALAFLRSWDDNHPNYWSKNGFSNEEGNVIIMETRKQLISNTKERIESMKAATPTEEKVDELPF